MWYVKGRPYFCGWRQTLQDRKPSFNCRSHASPPPPAFFGPRPQPSAGERSAQAQPGIVGPPSTLILLSFGPAVAMSDEEHHFETSDAGASKTFPQQAGAIRKGGYLVIKGRPCKVRFWSLIEQGVHREVWLQVVPWQRIFHDVRSSKCRLLRLGSTVTQSVTSSPSISSLTRSWKISCRHPTTAMYVVVTSNAVVDVDR